MRKIAVITGTRAEYGLLKPLLFALKNTESVKLQLCVTGMHLSQKFGHTIDEITNDGFDITKTIDSDIDDDSTIGISNSIAKTITGFSKAFEDLNADIIIVLGDRSEIFAAATAATVKGIVTAHIHGGETTEGAYDEAFRHSITKMSHWHFTAAEVYKNRVIQLGEHPKRVFNVGAIGIDSINNLKLLNKSEFENSINTQLKKRNVMVTFHPVTLENNTAASQFKALLSAIDILEDTLIIFTKANSDKNGQIINALIDDYVKVNSQKAIAYKSLGQLRYLSALQHIDMAIGNSSSGILEVPYFKKPTINIGDRQKGRLMPFSVINCEPKTKAIQTAIKKAYDSEFLKAIETTPNLYGNGKATEQILDVITQQPIPNLKKAFYDLK